jgi:hypothetical protein
MRGSSGTIAMIGKLNASGTAWLWVVLVFSILACVGGIAWAVKFGSAADGMRGGVLAVAASFAMLFLGRNTAARVLPISPIYPGVPSELEAEIDEELATYAAGTPEARSEARSRTVTLYRYFHAGGSSFPGSDEAMVERAAESAWTKIQGAFGEDRALAIEQDAKIMMLGERLAGHTGSLRSLLDWQRKETWFLAISSVVGTFVAGFGDVLAAALGAPVR